MRKTNTGKIRKRTRIASKPRFTLFCVLCVLTLTTCIGSLTSVQATKSTETYTLMVSAGDTLWEIARSENTAGKDVRNVIDDIMKLNNMRSTNIHAGDMLQIPIY